MLGISGKTLKRKFQQREFSGKIAS